MDLKFKHLKSFSVIGKETSSIKGKNTSKEARDLTNQHFDEVKNLAQKDKHGQFVGFWGLMSSEKRDLSPWEDNFSKGLYLAGPQVSKDSIAPEGWVKRDVPERDYVYVEIENLSEYMNIFSSYVYFLLAFNRYELVGAAFDYTSPTDGKNYIYFPVKKYDQNVEEIDKSNKIAVCGCHCGYCFFSKCGGCTSSNNFCSFAAFSKDKKCPNVECCKEKELEGCYECSDLVECKKGFFNTEQCAKASCIFIKKEGKEVFDKTIRNAIRNGVNYSKDFVEAGNIDKQLELFYKFYTK